MGQPASRITSDEDVDSKGSIPPPGGARAWVVGVDFCGYGGVLAGVGIPGGL